MLNAWQITVVLLLSLADVSILSFGVFFAFYFKHNLARQLCTIQLQRRREELLSMLEAMKCGVYPAEEEEAEDEDDIFEADLDEDADEDDGEEVINPSAAEAEIVAADAVGQNAYSTKMRILPVKNMTDKMRSDFSLVGAEHDEKRFYARFSYSFEAKLRCADESVKQYYTEFMNEVALYKGLKTRISAKQVRIYKGTKTFGLLLFRGKSLWVAYALDPVAYADTKFKGKDMSDKKRFEKTPMLLKIGSRRKLGYAQLLLEQFAEKNIMLLNDNPNPLQFDLSPMTVGELYEAGLLHIKLVGEVESRPAEKTMEALIENLKNKSA